MKQVIVVSSKSCHYCDLGKSLLRKNGIDFKEIDASAMPNESKAGVPLLIVYDNGDKKQFRGYDPKQWLALAK
jgi:glutaredoxin